MIIAIDGPSGTGKSTVAKGVASRLGFTFFDTGAMYRSFAWKIRKDGVDPSNEEKVAVEISSFSFEIKTNEKGGRIYFVNGSDVTGEIRSPEISLIASQIAIYPAVRRAMVKMQRHFGSKCDAVFEGRDMGTVVFPDADLKIFLDAKPIVRADRRYQELVQKFPEQANTLKLETVLKEIEDRDKSDSNRCISPLKQAPDAIRIDTSNLSIEEVIEKIVQLIPKKKKVSSMKLSFRLAHAIAHLFFRLFFRLKVYGAGRICSKGGLLIANHCSFYDPPILSVACPEEVHFLAKESLFRVPLLGWIIKILNAHPVSRSASDIHVLRQMVELLASGKKVIIFPEGRRALNGKLQPFERGFSFLAQKAKCTIFPAYIDGAFEAWPMGKKWPRLFGKITCVFGTPIEWEEFENFPKREAEQLLSEKCFQKISDLRSWLENGAQGDPP